VGLFDRFRGAQIASNPADLVGVWQLVRSDSLAHEDAELEIRDDGRMTYSIRAGATWQVMKLTYRVDGDTLVSNQPSAPREERTRFVIERDGTLMLALGGEQNRFRRSEKRAPALEEDGWR